MSRRKLIFLLGIFLLSSPLAFAETYVGGEITEDTTWTLEGSPYIVTSDVGIYGPTYGSTTTLTIEPGVEVRFESGVGMYVGGGWSGYYGAIVAQGTQDQPIRFTSNSDTPSPGDWKGIYFRDKTNDELTILEHCLIEYAGATHNANLYLDNASFPITNSLI
jgi:hypothetical protein